MKKIIYVDHAATTKISSRAYESMLPYFKEKYKNSSTLYSSSRDVKNALNDSRKIISKCINANPEEIIFTSGGSESDNFALKGFVFANWKKDITIVTTPIEHHAILHTCAFLRNIGIDIRYLNVDNKGIVLNVESTLPIDRRLLVSVMMANNEIGTIQDIKSIANVVHEANGIFHTDAVQAIGHIDIDVKKLDIDMLSASAHKFNGPKGIGFLYVKKGIALAPLICGGSQEFGLRAGTENIANIVGMATALNESCENIKSNEEYLNTLSRNFMSLLNESNVDFIINGSSNRIPGNISLSIAGISGEGLLHYLDLYGIEIATGSACNSKDRNISHVITSINIPPKYVDGTIRISFGRENTIDDIVLLSDKIIEFYYKYHNDYY